MMLDGRIPLGLEKGEMGEGLGYEKRETGL